LFTSWKALIKLHWLVYPEFIEELHSPSNLFSVFIKIY
jgi:hypothetical protein